MNNLTKINENIHRLTMPYKDIYTTVYTVRTDAGVLLFDAASTDRDTESYIIPMLEELKISREELKCVFISHDHRDHSGGLLRLISEFPDITVLSRKERIKQLCKGVNVVSLCDGESFMDVLKLVSIPGHTDDSAAVFDTRTNTMITGDSLQVYGIFGSEEWGSNINLTSEYLEAIKKLRKMEIDNIYSAHDYHPYGFKAEGRDAVRKFIDGSEEPIIKILELIKNNPELDDLAIHDLYKNSDKVPPVKPAVITAARKSLKK